MTLPNFLIIGAAKAGTTSLYDWLRQHPDVFMPRLKEPRFFGWDGRGDGLMVQVHTLEEYDGAVRAGQRARPRSARPRRST